MLFLYCVGAVAGPTIASSAMTCFGPAALFVQNAAVHVVLVGFTAWRLLTPARPVVLMARLTAPEGLGRAA
jgi:hypothetical protein